MQWHPNLLYVQDYGFVLLLCLRGSATAYRRLAASTAAQAKHRRWMRGSGEHDDDIIREVGNHPEIAGAGAEVGADADGERERG